MFKYVATKLYLKRNTNVKVTAIFSNNFFILMVIGKLSKFLESTFLESCKSLMCQINSATSSLPALVPAQQVTCRTRPLGSCGKLLAVPSLGRQALLNVYLKGKFEFFILFNF
jgi:hypothetical protein